MTSTPTIAPPAAAGRGAPSRGVGNDAGDADSGAEFAEVVSAVKAEAASGSEKSSAVKDGAGKPGAAEGHTGAPGLLKAPGQLKLQAEAALTDPALTDPSLTDPALTDPALTDAAATAPVLPTALSLQVAPAVAVAPDPLATEQVLSEATEDAAAAELAAAAAAALLAQAAVPATLADGATAPQTSAPTVASEVVPVAVFTDAAASDESTASPADPAVDGVPAPGAEADAEGDLGESDQERPTPRGVVTSAAPPAVGFSASAAAGRDGVAPGRDTILPVAAREPATAAAPTSTDSALIFSNLPAATGVEGPSATAPATPGTPAGTAAQLAGAVFSVHRRGVEGTRQLTVDVTPEDLGPIRLTVTIRAGEVHILLGGSSELSREALRQALPELRKVLEDAGVATGNFDVHPDQPDSRPDWAASANNAHRDSSGSSGSRSADRSSSAAQTGVDASASRSPRAVAMSGDRTLDLHL